MAGAFGVSFLPGSQDPQNGNGEGMAGRSGPTRNPVQEAVKILSLRLPKFYGSQSLAPAPLLSSPGGMGQPGAKGNVTAQALSQLAGLPPSMPMPTMPAPQIPQAPSGLGGGDDYQDSYRGWMDRERGLGGGRGVVDVPQAPQASIDLGPPPLPTPPPVIRPGHQPPSGDSVPEDIPQPAPAPVASPWDRPGRNENLREKYLALMDQLGSLY
jgi:hypothetical protein